ncbi:MAG: peptide/nickel transport system substrate-binding protein [Acidimicrobiales bacterium]|jgi:peptide/nickel transport system substrate-binding protein
MNLQNKTGSRSLLTRYFSFLQRRSYGDRFLFHIALIAVFVSLFYVLGIVNTQYVTSVPSNGGTLVEGIVGTPRFVNPVLSITRADHDMVALIYSGLMKLNEEGTLVPDLAQSIEISENGRTYHVTLKQDIRFHNNDILTTRDFAYTIALIQNPDLKSPLRGNWDGVLIEELGEYEFNIILEEVYAPFMENLTVGILPRSLWDELPTEQLPFSQNNTEPIGAGPYKVSDVLRNKSGLINAYELTVSPYTNENPNIDTLVFNFYQNEEELLEALENKEIASTPSLSPESLSLIDTDTYTIVEKPLPRTFSIFFNQNKSSALRDKSVREALNVAIDRSELIDTILFGHGIPISTPVPPGFITIESEDASPILSTDNQTRTEQAKIILEGGGWTQTDKGTWEKEIDEQPTTLSVVLTTANTPLFDQTATFIVKQWEALGVQVSTDQFEQTDLVQAIIRPRSFEALLFGNDIGRSVDLYPFWHSSQKDDPGLNIAQYANIDTDALLEKIRTQTDQTVRAEAITEFTNIITEEIPAIFLYTPTFSYVIDADVSINALYKLSKPYERFENIASWHMTANNLWPVFNNN